MCRKVYRNIRSRVVATSGGTNSQFDDAVRLELNHQGLQHKPINWVLCASEIEREEAMRADLELNHENEMEAERQQQLYEDYMENKHDFRRDN